MAKANVSLSGRDILDLESLSVEEIELVLKTAEEMKKIMKKSRICSFCTRVEKTGLKLLKFYMVPVLLLSLRINTCVYYAILTKYTLIQN